MQSCRWSLPIARSVRRLRAPDTAPASVFGPEISTGGRARPASGLLGRGSEGQARVLVGVRVPAMRLLVGEHDLRRRLVALRHRQEGDENQDAAEEYVARLGGPEAEAAVLVAVLGEEVADRSAEWAREDVREP